jgi:hypothetical protein
MAPADSKPDSSELNFMGAIEAHVRWKIRLEAYINGTSEEHLDPDVVCRDDQCALGKWIYGGGGVKYGTHPMFPVLKQTHMNFHRSAGDIIRAVDAGEKEKARTMLNSGDYARYSHRVKSDLARLSIDLEGDVE